MSLHIDFIYILFHIICKTENSLQWLELSGQPTKFQATPYEPSGFIMTYRAEFFMGLKFLGPNTKRFQAY